jgi:hypothetical protein
LGIGRPGISGASVGRSSGGTPSVGKTGALQKPSGAMWSLQKFVEFITTMYSLHNPGGLGAGAIAPSGQRHVQLRAPIPAPPNAKLPSFFSSDSCTPSLGPTHFGFCSVPSPNVVRLIQLAELTNALMECLSRFPPTIGGEASTSLGHTRTYADANPIGPQPNWYRVTNYGLSGLHAADGRPLGGGADTGRCHGQLPCGQVLLHRRMTVQMGNSSEISGPMYRLAAAGRRYTVKAHLPRKTGDRMTS